jgi:prolipoprotein diacylglyceryl transferase
VPIRAYALFIIVGIIVALVLGQRRWEARGGPRDGVHPDPEGGAVVYDVALWAVPFGLIGGRLYHVITDWRTYFGDDGAGFAGALRIWEGGLGIWGAVALGGVGAWLGCRQRGIPLPAFADAIAPGIILAQAIGRLGNYFNQELYGRPTTLPWGLEIYERRDAAGALDTLNGVSTGQLIEVVHPTFLYELLWNLLVFAALIYIDRRFKIGHGRLFAMYVAGYCLGRFWIELMRSDFASQPIEGIRVNSFTATFVFIGAVVYIMVAPKGREDPATLAGKSHEGPEVEDAVETFAKELTAVAATTGVVAAAKAAGEAEDEDAASAEGVRDADVEDVRDADAEEPEEPETKDAEALGADVAGVPAETVEDAEEFAAEGEDEAEAEGEDEPEAEGEAGAEAEGDDEAEAKAEGDDEAEAEGDEEPASEAAAEAEALVEDVADAPAEDIQEAQDFAEAGEEAEQAEAEAESEASEPDEPETEDAEAAVEEAEAEPSEEDAAEEAEAVAEEADSAAEEEPETGVLAEAKVDDSADEPDSTDEPGLDGKPEPASAPVAAEQSGGRLGRWLRRNR